MNRQPDVLTAIGIIALPSTAAAAVAFWMLPNPFDLPLCLLAFGAVLMFGVIVVSAPILDRSRLR